MAHLDFLGAAGTVTGSKLLVEHEGTRVLVDCGLFQGRREESERRNRVLKVDPLSVDAVVLSHGHYDHTGGLKDLVESGAEVDLYLHPAALHPKYHQEKTPPHRSIGTPEIDEPWLQQRARRLVWTREPREVSGRSGPTSTWADKKNPARGEIGERGGSVSSM